MGISILSYRGAATLSVVSDAHLVPDPEAITERFAREFAGMQAAVRRRERRLAGAKSTRRGAAAKKAAKKVAKTGEGALAGRHTGPAREALKPPRAAAPPARYFLAAATARPHSATSCSYSAAAACWSSGTA